MGNYLRTLWAKRNENPIEFATLIVTFLGFLIAFYGGYLVLQQISEANRTLQNQAENAIDQVTLDFDKELFEHPTVIPYLDGRQVLSKGSKDWDEVRAAASMQLDFFDTYYGVRENLAEQDPQALAWKKYITRSFTQSAVLCNVWSDEVCEHSNGVEKMARKLCPKPLPEPCSVPFDPIFGP